MNLSDEGLDLIKRYESCDLTAYQDIGGIWTIGYGHTGKNVTPGLTWTQDQADAALRDDTQNAVAEVNRVVKVPLTQGEFDALVSFTYNVGSGALESSTMLKLLNQGDYSGAAAEFERWDKVHGVVVAGLLRRRLDEEQEFDT